MLRTFPATARCLAMVLVVCLGGPFSAALRAADEVERASLPRQQVDTDYQPAAGQVIAVARGGDLQQALERAAPGDVIELAAGAVYEGPFHLPRKSGAGWIIIRTAAEDQLPPPGTRVDPSLAPVMATLQASSDPVISTASGAHHFRFIGVEIRPTPGAGMLRHLVMLGSEEDGQNVAHHIIFDRCYLHGDPEKGTRRGIALNSAHSAVVDSWLADFKSLGTDSQAIAGWTGPGPFKILNNYLEGAGENILFGGGDPAVEGLVPSDIVVRGNHFAKPRAWREGSENYAGTPWAVKNLFELKNARRVLVEGNLFEYNWLQSQNGYAILFTVRNQEGTAPWSTVEDVTFSNNIVRHVGAGINILGRDDNATSQQANRFVIDNNLFVDMGGEWGDGTFLQLLEGVRNLVVERNTVFNAERILMADGKPHEGFVFAGNIAMHGRYGMIGTGSAPGNDTLEKYFPGGVTLRNNVIVGGADGNYPGPNEFPGSVEGVGFLDYEGGDYRLSDNSDWRRDDPGASAGVNFVHLCEALSSQDRPGFCHQGGDN